jgi:transposase
MFDLFLTQPQLWEDFPKQNISEKIVYAMKPLFFFRGKNVLFFQIWKKRWFSWQVVEACLMKADKKQIHKKE